MYGSDISCGISKVPFEIPQKISDPYIERCVDYWSVKYSEILDLQAGKYFLKFPGPLNDFISPIVGWSKS